MRVDEQLMDIGILDEGFELTHLWGLREAMIELRSTLEGLKEKALNCLRHTEVIKLETKLYYVNRNLEIVEAVMSMKELGIFELTEYGEICSN